MGETDKTVKTTRWAMTVFEQHFGLLETIPSEIAEWGWQDEKCPETDRLHRQGYFRTTRQMRFSQVSKLLPGIHIEPARDWNKLLNYCKKKATSLGNVVHQVNENKPMTMADALLAIAKFAPNAVYLQENEKHLDAYKRDYWDCVNKYLRQPDTNPNCIGLFTNTQMLTAWINTRQFWINKIEPEGIEDAQEDAQNCEQEKGNFNSCEGSASV